MNIDAEHLSIPETEYDANVQLPSAEFKRIVTDLSALSETVTISVTKEGITFSVEGELANGSVTLKAGGGSIDEDDEDSGVVINMNQATTCILSLKYLQNFTKATPLSSRVHLGLSSDVPVLTEYRVENVGYIQYYLAPKMDDEE
jgi:proliferating cell nuclear antigen